MYIYFLRVFVHAAALAKISMSTAQVSACLAILAICDEGSRHIQLVWYGMVLYGLVWYDGRIQCVMIRFGMVRLGTSWSSMVWLPHYGTELSLQSMARAILTWIWTPDLGRTVCLARAGRVFV